MVNLEHKLCAMLKKAIAEGHFVLIGNKIISKYDGCIPLVQWVFDAAKVVRGRKVVSIAFKFVNGDPNTNSPKNTHEICLAEGGDDHATLQSMLGESIEEINGFISRSSLVMQSDVGNPEFTVAFDVCGGADQAGLKSVLGLTGCNDSHPCGLCEVPKGNVCSTDLQYLQSVQRRELERSALLAHLRLGVCPGCKMQIVKVVTNSKTQMKLAEEGDDEPNLTAAQKRDFNTTSWKTAHLGQRYARSVLIKIPITRWAVCILHMHLRFVKMLVERTILARLDQFRRDGKKDDYNKISETCWELFVAAGIPVPRFQTPSNTLDTHYQSISRYSFAGHDAAAMIVIWPIVLAVVYPLSERRDSNTSATYKSSVGLWSHYQKEVWKPLNEVPKGREARVAKAKALQAAAIKFVDMWVSADCATEHLYIHVLVAHVPEQLLSLPADLWYLQIQGLEHVHKIRKAWARALSNCHKSRSTHHVPARLDAKGNVVRKAYTRGTGSTMCSQLLALPTLDDDEAYRSLLLDEEYIAELLAEHADPEVVAEARKTLEGTHEFMQQVCALRSVKRAREDDSKKRSTEKGLRNFCEAHKGKYGDGDGDGDGDSGNSSGGGHGAGGSGGGSGIVVWNI
jgi:uncharacterized membrane protein YgcG